MAGAEIALVNGTRVKVGATDDCDIVIADAALPTFTLDVSETAVTLVSAAGDARAMKPFQIEAEGTTAIVIGPAEGAWQPLVHPAPEPAPAADTTPAETEDKPAASETPESKATEATPTKEDETAAPKPKRKGHGCGCALVLVVLLIAMGVALWFYREPLRARYPHAVDRVERIRKAAWKAAQSWYDKAVSLCKPTPPTPEPVGPTLEEIAHQYGLVLAKENGRPCLKGNVARRTERLAIRALALRENEDTAFDLTDDESLQASADELLFVVTEGALKAVSASNRVVMLAGYAPNPTMLEQAIRALNTDVPGITRLDTTRIQVGGTPPASVAKTSFVAPAVKKMVAEAAAVAPTSRRDYPIAGIITKPYPLVVMRNGLRLAEGAQVGTAIIERIEADRLVLRDGKTTFEWKP